MAVYPASARERAMKVQEVILRALNKQITFWEAAHIARISPRQLRRLCERYRRPVAYPFGFSSDFGSCFRLTHKPLSSWPGPIRESALGPRFV
jgi:hypothetical protein